MNAIPNSQNQEWGFFGAMQNQAVQAWPLAVIGISQATNTAFEDIRPFLDSRFGRQFADDVRNKILCNHNIEDAITLTIKQWMDWTISSRCSKETGIPCGISYLTGFVTHSQIEEELI